MSMIVANGKAREASIEVTVIRADGSIERLGTVSYWHRNPFKRLAWRVHRWLGINR